MSQRSNPYGDGRAAQRILDAIAGGPCHDGQYVPPRHQVSWGSISPSGCKRASMIPYANMLVGADGVKLSPARGANVFSRVGRFSLPDSERDLARAG